ncbi:MAG: hypothetical protein Q9159_002997 [Coniocarpon cinnabarinum]
MRVYEWGPSDGRKVLFVHGDATPCPLFAKIADGLVKRGCRVLLFDSHQDVHLFSLQITYAINSSPIAWTGPHKFSIVAFSLGAPISLDFITAFPWLIERVIFLAPAGLIRALPESYSQIRNAAAPLERHDPKMRTMVEAILGVNADEPMQKALVTKVKDNGSHLGQDQILQAEPSEPIEFDMGALLQWQYEFNEGHVYALYDTIRHGPSVGQEHLWSRFAGLMTEKVQSQPRNTLSRTKLIVVFGADDDVVVRAEAKEDILEILPDDKVDFARVPGSHGFVYPNSNQIVDIIAHAWGF